jgi:glycosyltransferase involved in cell wall biosynthesis
MRILQLHTCYRQPGGEDAVVRAEQIALERAGHQVQQHIEENPVSPARAAVALAGSLWNPLSARRVVDAIDAARPDVAHVHNTWFASSPSVLSALRRRRIPVVMTVHNYRLICVNALFLRDGAPCEKCLDHGPWPAIRHRCYRGSRATSAVAAAGIAVHRGLDTWSRLVDRFIVLSEFARGRLVRAGLPSHRLTRGSNFVEDPGPRATVPSKSRNVLFVGRLSPEKGVQVLLDAWRTAALGELRLDVIGDGPDRARLEEIASPGVAFLGRRPAAEVMSRLLQARALVIPSVWYEGQPVTALESLAAGTPLILSGIGGLPEILGGGDGGWITPVNRSDALARRLELLANDHAVDARSAHARQRYLDAFTPSAAVVRLEAVYADAQNSALS